MKRLLFIADKVGVKGRKMSNRTAQMQRKTKETDIQLSIDLDGSGNADIDTGIGFFDHMLEAFARHGLFDLTVKVKGDLAVDCHHTIEDTGIVLGQAILKALGDKAGINRYGHFTLPMDETLSLCALDLSGRGYLAMNGSFKTESVGDFKCEMVKEFFYAVAIQGAMNLHLQILSGENDHHKIEALFKSFARALSMAVEHNPRLQGVWSTKGSLA